MREVLRAAGDGCGSFALRAYPYMAAGAGPSFKGPAPPADGPRNPQKQTIDGSNTVGGIGTRAESGSIPMSSLQPCSVRRIGRGREGGTMWIHSLKPEVQEKVLASYSKKDLALFRTAEAAAAAQNVAAMDDDTEAATWARLCAENAAAQAVWLPIEAEYRAAYKVAQDAERAAKKAAVPSS